MPASWAELLRGNQLKPVYPGETGVRMLRELSRNYLTIVKDLSRVISRLKAVYRSWAVAVIAVRVGLTGSEMRCIPRLEITTRRPGWARYGLWLYT